MQWVVKYTKSLQSKDLQKKYVRHQSKVITKIEKRIIYLQQDEKRFSSRLPKKASTWEATIFSEKKSLKFEKPFSYLEKELTRLEFSLVKYLQ